MPRRFVNTEVTFNSKHGLGNVVVREQSLIDDFYSESHEIRGRKRTFHLDPIYMLFNQKRLNQLSPQQVQEWVQSMTSRGDSQVAELKKRCSDAELCTMIRSRSLQTPAEIMLWVREVNENQNKFNDEIQRVKESIDAEEAAETASVSSVES